MPIRKISTLPNISDYDFRASNVPISGDYMQMSIQDSGEFNSARVDYDEIRNDIQSFTLNAIDYATTTVSGLVYLATQVELDTGTNSTKAVTSNIVNPYLLHSVTGQSIAYTGKANDTWYDVDFSAITGAKKTMIHLKSESLNGSYGSIYFRTKGDTDYRVASAQDSGVRGGLLWTNGQVNHAQVITDSNGIVQWNSVFSGANAVTIYLEAWQRMLV